MSQAYRSTPSENRSTWLIWILVILVLAIGARFLAEQLSYAIARGRERAEVEIARGELANLPETSRVFSLVAQSIGPSVVHIDRRTLAPWRRPGDEIAALYGAVTGQGSGVIVDEAGYVITNFHVVRDAGQIDVLLSDGRRIAGAEVIGADEATDLAVLKIPSGGLIAAPWGDSDALEAGDWVLAVGNPFGLDRSVTAGIVSATQRNITQSVYQDFLQTDAAVNPGNSGGPLVNLRGEVVGITTAIWGESYRGISFAIKSDLARDVYERIRQNGSVTRGFLGVELGDLTPDLAEQLNMDLTEGAFVVRVQPGGPAAAAGIESDDLIIEWNGQPVHDKTELVLLVSRSEPGTDVQVGIQRGNQHIEITVRVGERVDAMAK